jgi:hypothetical protein
MSSKKGGGRSSRTTSTDLESLFDDVGKLGLEARVLVTRRADGKLLMRAEVFRAVDGVRFGVAAFVEDSSFWGGETTAPMWRTLVKAYWRASELAHASLQGPNRYKRS